MRTLAITCVAAIGILAGSENGVALAAPQEEEGETVISTEVPGYKGAGRRDPFVRPGHAPGGEETPCGGRGLEGVRARDLAVRGVVKTREGFVALLVGPRGDAHFARVGSRLCDGSVRAIEPAGVMLEEIPGPGDFSQLPHKIRLRLHGE